MRINRLETAAVAVTVLVALAGCIPQSKVETTSASSSVSAESSVSESHTSAADVSTDSSESADESDMVLGGWETNGGDWSIESGSDAGAAFDKVTENLDGADYEPVALLGTQVVAGTNYCILCRETVVIPDSEPTFVKVYIYEDLDGNAEITGVEDVSISPAQ